MKKSLLTVVTATYNSEKTLTRTIESLLKQTNLNFEYILVDGESTDKTVEIIKSFENQFKEKEISYLWISEKDLGIYDAFNKGIKLSKGDWISFLGSDDYYLEDALNNYFESINKLQENIDFVYSNIKVENKKIISDLWTWEKFRRKMNIPHVGSFHNVKYFKKYGFFNTNYKIAGDYELLLRAKKELKTHKVDKITTIMSDGGISNNQVKKLYLETTKAKIETGKINRFISNFDYVIWILKYKIKTLLNAFTR
jgi:glycosyltransferase involved in cell wall biosynthesis